ncbi:hypothetical protein BH24ACT26_BH24ACT26_00400 [soil metagenome]
MRGLNDERGLVVSWLMKLVVGLAVTGVVLYDAGAVMMNHVTLDSAANDIARELSSSVDATTPARTSPELTARAEVLARETGANLVEAEPDAEGALYVSLERRAETLLVRRIGPLKKWGTAVATGRAATS